jgi:hypothetical protein
MNENDVIAGICGYLEEHGYEIRQRLHTTQQGVDIIARELVSGRDLVIEAKGATSSREGSPRFGKEFTGTQVFDRVAKGVFTTLELRAEYPDRAQTDVALAVPDSSGFRRYLEPVKHELSAAGLRVFLVGHDLTVSELDR